MHAVSGARLPDPAISRLSSPSPDSDLISRTFGVFCALLAVSVMSGWKSTNFPSFLNMTKRGPTAHFAFVLESSRSVLRPAPVSSLSRRFWKQFDGNATVAFDTVLSTKNFIVRVCWFYTQSWSASRFGISHPWSNSRTSFADRLPQPAILLPTVLLAPT